MNLRVADAYNNPFHVDGQTSPPTRSALAVLGVERDEVRDDDVDALLSRAIERLNDDSDTAMVYGRPVTESDLRAAADVLRDPTGRAISEVLDFAVHRFDLSDVTELHTAVQELEKKVVRYEMPRVEDLRLVGRLLSEQAAPPEAPAAPRLERGEPVLPSTTDLLDGLA